MTSPDPTTGYSVANALRLGWGSVTGDLLPERVALLDKYLIGPRVLDAGCAGGAFVDALSRQGFDVTGVDKYPEFLAVAESRGYRGRFLAADLAEPLPFADNAFDTTICCDVLEHVPDDHTTIRELARVTKKRLIVTVPQEDRWMAEFRLTLAPYRDPTHLRYYTPDTLRALASSVSPASVEIFGDQPVPIAHLARQLIQPRGRFGLLTRVYGWLFKFLVVRAPVLPIHINLAAIIDMKYEPQATITP